MKSKLIVSKRSLILGAGAAIIVPKRALSGWAIFQNSSSGGGTNNIAVRSSITGQPAGPTDYAVTLPSAHTGEPMFLAITANAGHDDATVTDSNGSTWTRYAITAADGNNREELWSAIAGSNLTNNVITYSNTHGPGFIELVAWCFSGVGGTVFDTSGSLPATATSSPVSVTTTHAIDAILSCSRNGGNAGPASTFTQIEASASFTLVQFKKVTATQSSLSVADPSGSCNGMIGTGIQSS